MDRLEHQSLLVLNFSFHELLSTSFSLNNFYCILILLKHFFSVISTFFCSIIVVCPFEFNPAKITALFSWADTPALYLIPIGISEEINLNGKLNLFLGKKKLQILTLTLSIFSYFSYLMSGRLLFSLLYLVWLIKHLLINAIMFQNFQSLREDFFGK